MRKATLLPLLLCLAAAPIADGPVVFEETFKSKLFDGWAWLREDKADWKLADGGLRIRMTPGNLWEKENGARNLLLREPPKDVKAFTAEVTVSHTPADFGEQAGLLWYRDDDNYIKLVKEFYDGHTWVVFAAERDGKAEYREADCRAQFVTFRLTVAGDKVTASFLPVGGTDRKSLGEFTFPPTDEKGTPRARIGLTAHHGPADQERWAFFRDFRIVRAN